jgi:hypothetical protein
VGPADSLPELVKILDDGVPTLHDGFSAGSSSGVQMIGGTNPSERQTASMVLRITAFARCPAALGVGALARPDRQPLPLRAPAARPAIHTPSALSTNRASIAGGLPVRRLDSVELSSS